MASSVAERDEISKKYDFYHLLVRGPHFSDL